MIRKHPRIIRYKRLLDIDAEGGVFCELKPPEEVDCLLLREV